MCKESGERERGGGGGGGGVVEGGELKGERGIKIDLNCFSVLVNLVPLYGND